jgi:GT2 family glycosyltransferase
MRGPEFTVAICTRDRPERLEEVLAALDAQTRRRFPVVIVDQSRVPDSRLRRRAAADSGLTVIPDSGHGLSRSRNLACANVASEWIAFLDDDCVPDPDWAEAVSEVLATAGEAGMVSGYVGPEPTDSRVPLLAAHPVSQPRRLSGRWTPPWEIGLGVCFLVRRSIVEELGGWDERLGAGTRPFPAAEDMDFNYRFLKAGGVGHVNPRMRVEHRQWRDAGELGPHFRSYMAGWCGFAMKQLRGGDVLGGLWLWGHGARDLARMAASGLRRRSRLRLRVAGSKLAGFVTGTARGLTYRW